MFLLVIVLASLASIPVITSGAEQAASHRATLFLHHTNGSQSRSRRQTSNSGSRQCVLPIYPDHGTYAVLNVPNAAPGQAFESFVLTVSCRQGFGFLGSAESMDGTASQQVFCVNGGWSLSLPRCVRFCELKPHHSVRYMCQLKDGGFRTCKKYVPPGTSVNPVCNSPLYATARTLPYMKCRSGYWDYIAECQAECGQVTPVGKQLVIGGVVAKRGELPWHVGVYAKTTDPYMQICSGTLVSNNVVISAAHCFWDDVRKRLPPSQFALAVGKIHRPWDSEKDVDVQKSDVRDIKIPMLFYGASTNFQEDIAILTSVTAFVYKTHIRPVCLHFDANFDRRQLQPGKVGKVAGWGLVAANGKPSPLLKSADMPYVSLQTCINAVPPSFREYLTADKFCAGYNNGTALCRGDSGGGLVFAAFTELDIERYYLRGVVSAAPSTDDSCNANTYTTFTRITKHEEFIKESFARADRSCPSSLFQCNDGTCVDLGADCDGVQHCPDGSDEAEELCFVKSPNALSTFEVSSNPACVLPPYPDHGTYEVIDVPNALPGQSYNSVVLKMTCQDLHMLNQSDTESGNLHISCDNGVWNQSLPGCIPECGLVYQRDDEWRLPWHVGIYYKDTSSYSLICGGSIITNTVVISVVACFTINRKSPYKYAVAAGRVFAPWNEEGIIHPQKSDVQYIHVSYLVRQPRHKDNIAVVTLVTPLVFSLTVQPVCLNLATSFEVQQLQKTHTPGWSVAWPIIERGNGMDFGLIEKIEITNLNFDECLDSVQPEEDENMLGKLCTGYPKYNNSKVILAGTGLVYPDGESERYYLVGAKVNSVVCGRSCVKNVDNYQMYTKLSTYKEFIEQYI